MERRGESEQAWPLLIEALSSPRNAAELQGFERLRQRLGKRLGQAVPPGPRAPAIPTFELLLPRPDQGSVEFAVAEYFASDEAPVHYVENLLFNGLLALLCWPAIYAPLPGAFFHPFQAAPADLYRSDFYQRRRALFEACLASLESGDYRDRILETWQLKQGISSPFLYWPLLTRELVGQALDCLEPLQLRACFERMLEDLREYRSGLPDLIQFWPDEQRCRLIEVKGPGDRLQDHQRRWLAFCIEQGLEVAVCHVQWQEAP
ncbi:VRR-NUC domain-containing protein [Marinobacterium aestuariivivens]|uniref:phosphodiesterase I n=1 Tax=Marinobacterium aestuariivivens TaxID=1698799 RepID=A0ABW2A3H7_9GAMM